MNRRLEVLLVGEFGCGNYGNDASLLSVMERLHAAQPDLVIRVLARDAAKIRQSPTFAGMDFRVFDLAYRPLRGRFGQAIGRLTDPLRYLRHVAAARTVIVPGMGVLEGELGEHPFGVPYLLFVVSILCCLSGTPLAFVAVGASPLHNKKSRWFALRTAGLVSYRTFRDVYSRKSAAAGGIGSTHDRVTTDVAFSQPVPEKAKGGVAGIGVGVMNFYGRHPERARLSPAEAHEQYLDKMTELSRGIAERGRAISLFAGDDSDVRVAHVLAQRLAADGSPDVTVSSGSDYRDIVSVMGGLEAVVAPRYHNVVAAVAAGRPVIALRYAEKSEALVRQAGMHVLAPDLDDWDPQELLVELDSVLERSELLAESVRQCAERLHALSLQELSALAGQVMRSGRRRDWSRFGREG